MGRCGYPPEFRRKVLDLERPGLVLADSSHWSIADVTAIPDALQQARKDGQPSVSKSEGLRAAILRPRLLSQPRGSVTPR